MLYILLESLQGVKTTVFHPMSITVLQDTHSMKLFPDTEGWEWYYNKMDGKDMVCTLYRHQTSLKHEVVVDLYRVK